MKRLVLIIIVALLSPLGWSQSSPVSGSVINQYGQPVAGAQVYICSAAGSSGLPCSPVATIYQDYNLVTPIANPTQTDENGNFNVYVGPLVFPNTYVVNAVPESGTTYTWLYPGPSCPLSGCTFTGEVTAPLFNATQSPYYEINGTQISSSALSDTANLAKLNASNTFTGTTQTAPVWNATSAFTVNGVALGSTNLSDTTNLARLNAANNFTGATNTFNAITGTTINATSGFQVGGVALSASNLSNGVSGTGAVCLAVGSACTSSISAVTSVGVSSSTATQLTVSGSPITSSGVIMLGLNLTGTEAKVVTAAAAGTATHCANWNSSGGIGDSGYACFTMTTPLTCNSNGCYRVSSDGLVEEWVYGVSLANNSPTTIFLPTSIPNTVIGIQCSDNGGRVQSGNDQPVGANVAGLGAPYSYFYANTPATSVSTSCYITGK